MSNKTGTRILVSLHRNVDDVRKATLSSLVQEEWPELTGAANDPNVAYCATNALGDSEKQPSC